MALAVVLFAAALAVIASERVDRTKVALVGAVLVLLSQTIEQEAAIEAIDWNTLGLLAGMMLMVKITEPTGVYTWLAIRAGQLSRGQPLAIVMSLATTTALLSAFLDNLTTVLLMVPITFLREAPLLTAGDRIEHAVRELLHSGLPALPVVDARGTLRGIFGALRRIPERARLRRLRAARARGRADQAPKLPRRTGQQSHEHRTR